LLTRCVSFGANKNSPKTFNGGRNVKDFVSAGVDLVREIANSRLSGGSSSNSQQKSSSGSAGGSGNQQGQVKAVNLTSSTYKTKGNGLWFIMYYAPWCPHCKNAMGAWDQAANSLKGVVSYGKVDCTTEQSLCGGVEGYPTFKFYDNDGKKTDFNGERDFAGFMNFGRRMSGQGEAANPGVKEFPVSQLVEQKNFDEYCVENKGSVCILAFLPHILDTSPKERAEYLKIIEEIKKRNSGKPFNFLWSQGGDQFDFEESMNLGMGYPAIIAFVAGKKKFSVMRRAWSQDNLSMYINGLSSNQEHFYTCSNYPDSNTKLPKKLKKVTPYDPKAFEEKADL